MTTFLGIALILWGALCATIATPPRAWQGRELTVAQYWSQHIFSMQAGAALAAGLLLFARGVMA
jgi:hypothetical protein